MNNATIERTEQEKNLCLNFDGKEFKIPLTKDEPLEIKEVFNRLIIELKKGLIQFELQDDENDLYHHISTEYITQLNDELKSVYAELEDYNLLEIDEEE